MRRMVRLRRVRMTKGLEDDECKLVVKKVVGLTCTPGPMVPRRSKRILINYHQGHRIPKYETYTLKVSHQVCSSNEIMMREGKRGDELG